MDDVVQERHYALNWLTDFKLLIGMMWMPQLDNFVLTNCSRKLI